MTSHKYHRLCLRTKTKISRRVISLGAPPSPFVLLKIIRFPHFFKLVELNNPQNCQYHYLFAAFPVR